MSETQPSCLRPIDLRTQGDVIRMLAAFARALTPTKTPTPS